jgi:hypothetical protein
MLARALLPLVDKAGSSPVALWDVRPRDGFFFVNKTMRFGQGWVETPEAKALRVQRMKAAWAAKKAAGWKHPGFKNGAKETPKETHELATKATPETVEETAPRPAKALSPREEVALLRLITNATTALAEVDSIAVIEIERSLPSVTECARVKLALEHLVEKAERLLSLVRHCNDLLVSRRDRIESH